MFVDAVSRADPEQRQARNNGSKFTVLSVATQRCCKNAEDECVSTGEWHRVAIICNLSPGQTVG
jgi:single-stranded DNA-binding protein